MDSRVRGNDERQTAVTPAKAGVHDDSISRRSSGCVRAS
jgi:hypothetical protein